MMSPEQLDSVLMCASALGETIVLAVLVRRNYSRALPMFTVYIAWNVLSDLANLYFQHRMSYDAYVQYFNVQVIIDSVLQFGVLVELGWSALSPVRKSLPRGALPLLMFLVAIAGCIIWPLAAKTAPPSDMAHANVPLFHLDETFAILRIVCFLVLASLSQVLSIGWRDKELQVASGFGFYTIIKILSILYHSHQGVEVKGNLWMGISPYHWLDVAVSASYLGTLVYWVFSFATQEQKRKEFSPQMQHLLLQLGGGARAGRIALSDLPSERLRKKD